MIDGEGELVENFTIQYLCQVKVIISMQVLMLIKVLISNMMNLE